MLNACQSSFFPAFFTELPSRGCPVASYFILLRQNEVTKQKTTLDAQLGRGLTQLAFGSNKVPALIRLSLRFSASFQGVWDKEAKNWIWGAGQREPLAGGLFARLTNNYLVVDAVSGKRAGRAGHGSRRCARVRGDLKKWAASSFLAAHSA